MPLTREEHKELNTPNEIYPGGKEARDKRVVELRLKYRQDNVALQKLDGYALPSIYFDKLTQYRETFRLNDIQKIEKLTVWFEEHYPDIGPEVV